MILGITPEHFPGISAQVCGNSVTLSTAIDTSAALARPVPAALDPVSRALAGVFRGYTNQLAAKTGDGSCKLRDFGDVLVPVSVSYQCGDASGGAEIANTAIPR